ncbi:MAG: RraA family protein [Bryobacteraceae bacterium]|jgi:regulator of RNase E activity RraA
MGTQIETIEPVQKAQAFLSADEICALRKYTTPTVSNAIEILTGKREGYFTTQEVRCLYPALGPMVGYACTAISMSGQPARSRRHFPRRDYWAYVASSPKPRVIVMQELSSPPLGAFWGEVHSNIHKALGCEGVLLNGYVRDVEEVRDLKFHFLVSGISVSHAYAHLEDYDRDVEVFGMRVASGDLIHADRHGAVVIPRDCAHDIAATCAKIVEEETSIFQLCRSKDFSIAALDPLVTPDY